MGQPLFRRRRGRPRCVVSEQPHQNWATSAWSHSTDSVLHLIMPGVAGVVPAMSENIACGDVRTNLASNALYLYTLDLDWWRRERHRVRHPGRFPPTGLDRVIAACVYPFTAQPWKVVAQNRMRDFPPRTHASGHST